MGLKDWFSFSSITIVLFMFYLYSIVTSFYSILYPKPLQFDLETGAALQKISPLWEQGTKFNVNAYIGAKPVHRTSDLLIAEFKNLKFDEGLNEKLELTIGPGSLGMYWNKLGNNKILYAHFSIIGPNLNPIWAMSPLVKLREVTPAPPKRFLVKDWPVLGAFVPDDVKEIIHTPASKSKSLVGYWIPMAHASLVTDWTHWTRGGSPSTVANNLHIRNNVRYEPVVYTSLLGLTNEKQTQINQTVNNQNLTLSLEVGAMSLARWQYNAHMEETLRIQKQFGATEKDIDDLRHMFTETEPVLLGVTLLVTLFHVLFDILAFKSDITFWNNTKSTKGLSVKTLFVDLVSQLIITAYLYEQNASILVLVPSGLSIVVQIWKVKRAFSIGGSAMTDEYDGTATNWMLLVLMPVVFLYSLYSLVFEKHAGFYPWAIGSLASSVYAFGFVMMCPQIFINYKLKSVAHLPWRFFLYKSLNTFIDDLFAFIIRMPTMHRAACFRDDVVFFIYLYQRYIYPVDVTRKHEMADDDEIETKPLITKKND